ncbi:MAG: hypothetical protein WB422_12075, partial [Pseudolabrys sp.]
MGLISRPKLIAPPQFAPVCFEREILKQKQHVVDPATTGCQIIPGGSSNEIKTSSRTNQGRLKAFNERTAHPRDMINLIRKEDGNDRYYHHVSSEARSVLG